MSTSKGIRRHTASDPCRICGGFDSMNRGQGERCHGYLSSDEQYEHCSREDLAGGLKEEKGGTFAHRLDGECKCGHAHGPALAPPPRKGGGKAKAVPKAKARPAKSFKLPPEVARYGYLDEDGIFLFEVRKYVDPLSGAKTFLQWSQDERGTWVSNRKGKPEVLYLLAELIKSPPAEPVWIVEGEKCVQALQDLGLVATCNPGGAGKWRDEFSLYLKGRTVYLLPDNDPADPKTGKRTGHAHAHQVAASVAPHAAAVKVVDLVWGCDEMRKELEKSKASTADVPTIPPKGDVFDFLELGGTADDLEWMAKLAPAWTPPEEDEAEDDSWEEPWLADITPPRPFPLHVFPLSLERLVACTSDSLCAPRDYMAVSVLGTASACIGLSTVVNLKGEGFDPWYEPALAYLMIVGEASQGKSEPLKRGMRPIFAIKRMLKAEYSVEMIAHKMKAAAWRAEAKGGKGKAGDLFDEDEPRAKRVQVGETTVERLTLLMQRNPRGLLMYHDELSAWFAGMNQYKTGGKGNDRQFYLGNWSTSPVQIDRSSHESDEGVSVVRPFLSIVGGIQPSVLAGTETPGQQDGLMERFLFSHPLPVRRRYTEAHVPKEDRESWVEAGKKLYAVPLLQDDDDDKPASRVLTLTPEARRLFIEWHDRTMEESEQPDFPPALKAAWGKFLSYVGRLALILDRIAWAYDTDAGDDPKDPGQIGAKSMRDAIELVEYFMDHTERVRGSWRGGEPGVDEHAGAVLKWIKGANRTRFKASDLMGNFKRRFRDDRATLDRTLRWLESRHCVRKEAIPERAEGSGGRPRTPEWEVNPALLSAPPLPLQKSLKESKAPLKTLKTPPDDRESGRIAL